MLGKCSFTKFKIDYKWKLIYYIIYKLNLNIIISIKKNFQLKNVENMFQDVSYNNSFYYCYQLVSKFSLKFKLRTYWIPLFLNTDKLFYSQNLYFNMCTHSIFMICTVVFVFTILFIVP